MRSMTIGQVAREAFVGVETVRFYEKQGLIHEPPRRPSGYRQYPEQTVQRVRFIRRAKDLGFTLKEIGELLALQDRPDATCGSVKLQATHKLQDIKERIKALQRMQAALEPLVFQCAGKQSGLANCPILLALDDTQPEPEEQK